MTGPAYMSYSTLVENVKAYSERPNDAKLAAQIPQLVLLAENEVASDLKVLGTDQFVEGTLAAGQASLAKPEYWRATVSATITLSSGEKRALLKRTPEFLQAFAPDAGDLGVPRYYADLNATRFLFAPTPNTNFPLQLIYSARIQPLSQSNQTNWLTDNAPQVLLYSAMYHTSLFLKNFALAESWKANYTNALASLVIEDATRKTDRTNKDD